MKKVLKSIFAVLLIVGFLAYTIVFSIIDLTNKKDRHTLNMVYAFEILEVEHSINGLIPYGKDHYYFGIDDKDNTYLIKAPKNWDTKNFSSDDTDGKTVKITALAKRISDYEISKELDSQLISMELTSFKMPLGSSMCLNLSYVRDSIMKLASGILLIVLVLAGFIARKKDLQVPPVVVKVYVALFLVCLILMLFSMK